MAQPHPDQAAEDARREEAAKKEQYSSTPIYQRPAVRKSNDEEVKEND